jgi:hypothetical protein
MMIDVNRDPSAVITVMPMMMPTHADAHVSDTASFADFSSTAVTRPGVRRRPLTNRLVAKAAISAYDTDFVALRPVSMNHSRQTTGMVNR